MYSTFFWRMQLIKKIGRILGSGTSTWFATRFCIHFVETYMTELSVLHNPFLPISQILDNSKCCYGLVNYYKITRFDCTFSSSGLTFFNPRNSVE